MNEDFNSQLERAKELRKELYDSIKRDLESRIISGKTRNLTQEILVKLRNVLDQTMHSFFEKEIFPNLTKKTKKIKVYFPIVYKREDFTSSLNKSLIVDLDKTHPTIFAYLESIQPYNSNMSWLGILSRYSNERHVKLTPQKRIEVRRTTVKSNGGSVSWGSGVRFGKGISIMGAPVNPMTQDIEPTKGVESKKEIWVSFVFEDSNVNVLGLCDKSIEESEKIIKNFCSLF